ncbi:DUF6090 family protein [Winogradskyella ouciana]|uniref:Uncharacterized protein n=2 Tax=Winogradskyella ouciana TaxID=2608631 RepID=A0A7K1GEX9_9FLAO|nr:hypothetical protein [Winogradskyella ouciana]
MIQFFRKIRNNMIKENRFSKYLLYAIGEIILVVIGILIALQINNWNNNRLNKNLEKRTLISLKSDLNLQEKIIQRQIDKENFFMAYADSCLNMLNSNIEVKRLAVLLDTLSVRLTFVANKATFNNMGTGGKTAVISNPQLHKDIVEYYQFLDYTESVVNHNNLYRVNSQFGTYVLNNKLGINLRDNGTLYLKNDLMPDQKYELFKQLEGRSYSAENSRNKCELLLERTKYLIDLIDKELENRD